MPARLQTVLTLGLFAALIWARAVGGVGDSDGFRYERPLRPGAPGPNRVALDAAILAGAKPVRYAGSGAEDPPVAGLEDLRLFDAAGVEVPYLLMLPEARERRTIHGTLLAIPVSKIESGFEVDLGKVENVDRLTLYGLPSPLLKRYRLEGSGDRQRWITLVAEGTLFDLPEEKLTLLTAAFPAGPYRFLRWTWNDSNSGRVHPPAVVEARTLARSEPPAPSTLRLAVERRPSEPRVSRFHVRLPGRGLPVGALVLEVAPGDLLRVARVSEPRLGAGTVEPALLGEVVLRRSSRAGGVAAALAIPIAPPTEPGVDLMVEDGDSGPLQLAGVVARLRTLPWIYFESRDGDPVVARYGKPSARAPRYDLEASRAGAASAAASAATWGEVTTATSSDGGEAGVAAPPLGGPLTVAAFRYERLLAAAGEGLHHLPLDAAVLAHSRNLADLRLATPDSRQVPYLLERRDEPLEERLELAPWSDSMRPAAPTTAGVASRYILDLPFPGLPAARLAIATSARVFSRTVTLRALGEDSAAGTARWSTIARLDWRHAAPEIDPPELLIELPRLATARLLLEVEEGDNRALPLSGARLLLPSWRLRFFGAGSGLRLLYGDPALAAPRYDLALLAPRLVGVEGAEMVLPGERALTSADTTARSGRWFWIGLVGAVAVLLGLLARLLRGGAAT